MTIRPTEAFITLRKPQPIGENGVRFSLEEVARRSTKGRLDPHVRAWTVQQLKKAKDEGQPVGTALERAKAILTAIRKDFIYCPDPYHSELMTGPHLLITGVIPGGDCFAHGTRLLAQGVGRIAIERCEPGMTIWGLNDWTRVVAIIAKGVLPIDVIHLNTGTRLQLTDGHHVNVLACPHHPLPTGCDCPALQREMLVATVAELRPGMMLASPDRTLTHASRPVFVQSIDRAAAQVPCFDLQTEDHQVYLPEQGVTVRNCDDLTILTLSCFLAALSSVGVRCAVVGHAYDSDRSIQHVLAAVYEKNRWWYADPSTDTAFGEYAMRPTRERVLDVPCEDDAPAFCDATSCLTGLAPVSPPVIHRAGDFVGVDGLPELPPGFVRAPDTLGTAARREGHCPSCRMPFVPSSSGPMLPHTPSCPFYHRPPPASRRPAPSQLSGVGVAAALAPTEVQDMLGPAWGEYLEAVAGSLQGTLARTRAGYQHMIATAHELGIDPRAGYSPIWGPKEEQANADLFASCEFMLLALQDTLAGRRKAYAMPNGDLGIGRLPGADFTIDMPTTVKADDLSSMAPHLRVLPPLTAEAKPGVGYVWVILAAAGGASLLATAIGVAFNLKTVCESAKDIYADHTKIVLTQEYTKQVGEGKATHEQALELRRVLTENAAREKAAEAQLQGVRNDAPNTSADALKALTGVVVVGGLLYIAVEGFQLLRANKAEKASAARAGQASLATTPKTVARKSPA